MDTDFVLEKLLKEVGHLPWFENANLGDLKIASVSGDSLLHSAAIMGDLAAIDALVQRGVAINQKGSQGYTALHEAACQGNLAAYSLLVELGATGF